MTERQGQIARAVVLGESVSEVALRLGIRRQSVRRHLSALYETVGVRSQAALAGWCIAHGVVSLAELQAAYGRPRTRGRDDG